MGEKKLNNKHRINRHLACSQEVYTLIITNCINEYLKHHPEMLGAKISHNHILRQIGEHYIKTP